MREMSQFFPSEERYKQLLFPPAQWAIKSIRIIYVQNFSGWSTIQCCSVIAKFSVRLTPPPPSYGKKENVWDGATPQKTYPFKSQGTLQPRDVKCFKDRQSLPQTAYTDKWSRQKQEGWWRGDWKTHQAFARWVWLVSQGHFIKPHCPMFWWQGFWRTPPPSITGV